MVIHYVAGDLFANEHGAQALAHGCNCIGSMGAGIAVGFRERYPDMYEEYRRRCKAQPHLFNPGDCLLWKEVGLDRFDQGCSAAHRAPGASSRKRMTSSR
jgi:O-acetyl-ADP-ribose deacetylase (regulator of RNase III)